MRQIYGTLIGRWYVSLLGITFLWQASRHLGWRKTLLYVLVAVGAGAAAENASVHFGFPYTHYVFNGALRHKEVFVGDVPLMVPLSYTFLGYFGFATGRMVASGPRHTRARRTWQEFLLGVMLTVWALWIMDPISRLGSQWFLGKLFHYRGPGFWFGLPLGSQAGFGLTAILLVGMLTLLTRDEPDLEIARLAEHPHLPSLATYIADVLWLTGVALAIGAYDLAGSMMVVWVPALCLVLVSWSNELASRPAPAPEPVGR